MNVLKMNSCVTKCVKIPLEVSCAVVNQAMYSQMKGVKVSNINLATAVELGGFSKSVYFTN